MATMNYSGILCAFWLLVGALCPSAAAQSELEQARAKLSASPEGSCKDGAEICVRLNNVAAVELLLEVLRTEHDKGGGFLPQAHYRDVVWGALGRITDPYAQRRVEAEMKSNKDSAWTRQWCAELLGIYAAALHEDVDSAPDAVGRVHEVPVVYGDSDGPDLDAVAAHACCSPEAVIQRHASRTYRVFMLGFLPGFAYMGSVDDTIAVPRKPTPRLRVPAGSVGIAGQQTGVYPLDAPGGWHIIGRAGVTPFEPERVPPSLFTPGDEVRFVPVSALAVPKVDPAPAHADVDSSSGIGCYVTVLRPGRRSCLVFCRKRILLL
jgi:KipI family sensor histidine kinase inhibitor